LGSCRQATATLGYLPALPPHLFIEVTMEKKTCTKCKIHKQLSEFHNKPSGIGGVASACKLCASERGKIYREKHKGEAKARAKQYYIDNRDAIIAKAKAYRLENLDKIKARKKIYRQENLERIKAHDKIYRETRDKVEVAKYQKEYREDNKEQIKRSHAIYYINNREHLRELGRIHHVEHREANCERARKWAKDNPAKARARGAKRRVSLRSQTPPDADLVKIVAIYEECIRVTEETGIMHHVDHIIPIIEGGLHHEDNLQILTAEENLKKGAKLPVGAQYTLRLKEK
jgi:5-methylcytosine-specific restriction endonuclease McrA